MAKSWVIPDIHGYALTLRSLVENIIKPSKHDWLYFLGDYIDRGPDPKGVIDYLMWLKEEEYNVRFLRGNHEDYLLRIYNQEKIPRKFLGITVGDRLKREWYQFGGKTTMASFNVKEVANIPTKYIEWLKALEYYIVLDGFILVHAGMNFEIEDPFTDRHAMLWTTDFKAVPEKIDHKLIIHGHVPVSLDFIDLVRKKPAFQFIDLDNGIYLPEKQGFGNLVAMELNSMELAVQPNVD
jgi:serine/threonine protein phosphatase 1